MVAFFWDRVSLFSLTGLELLCRPWWPQIYKFTPIPATRVLSHHAQLPLSFRNRCCVAPLEPSLLCRWGWAWISAFPTLLVLRFQVLVITSSFCGPSCELRTSRSLRKHCHPDIPAPTVSKNQEADHKTEPWMLWFAFMQFKGQTPQRRHRTAIKPLCTLQTLKTE